MTAVGWMTATFALLLGFIAGLLLVTLPKMSAALVIIASELGRIRSALERIDETLDDAVPARHVNTGAPFEGWPSTMYRPDDDAGD